MPSASSYTGSSVALAGAVAGAASFFARESSARAGSNASRTSSIRNIEYKTPELGKRRGSHRAGYNSKFPMSKQTRQRLQAPPIDRFVPVLVLLFVGSGCSALIYEIVW